jgi:hypothetical protein
LACCGRRRVAAHRIWRQTFRTRNGSQSGFRAANERNGWVKCWRDNREVCKRGPR